MLWLRGVKLELRTRPTRLWSSGPRARPCLRGFVKSSFFLLWEGSHVPHQSVSQSYTPPSMEDGPTRTHTLHTIGSGADTRHAVTGRSTGSGLLDAQHTAHRTAHEVALYSGVLRDRHGRRRWSTGTGTQDSRTDIPTRAGGGGARERRGVWTRSLAGARPQIRRQSLQAASAIRAGSQKRSGAVLTASSQRTTEFTMMSEEKRCSCGTMR